MRTPSPQRGRSTGSVSWQPLGALSSMLSSTSTPCWEWAFLHSFPQLPASPFLTSTSKASSSKPCIHFSMLYTAVGVWFVFIVPWGHPSHLALVLFSTMAFVMDKWPSWTALTVFSTWASLPAQLTWPAKRNQTSLASPRGSPSLSDGHLKNKITSLGARTTASGICSSRPSWNMSVINELVHAWEGGGLVSSFFL